LTDNRGDSLGEPSDSKSPQLRRRKRHPAWQEAQKDVYAFVHTAEDRKKRISAIKEKAKKYREDIKDWVIVLQHREKEELLVLPYNTRFSEDYVEKQEWKMNRLKWKLAGLKGWCTFITITQNPKNVEQLIDNKKARKAVSEFMRWFSRKAHPRAYICVTELHHGEKAYGILHFHILAIGTPYVPLHLIKRKLRALGLGEEHVRGFKNQTLGAINYFMKYFRKSLKELYETNESLKELYEKDKYEIFKIGEVPELSAFLWALDMRFMTTSRIHYYDFERWIYGIPEKKKHKPSENSCLESEPRATTRLILHQWIYVGIYPSILFDKIPSKITDPNLCWQILQSKPPP